MFRKGKKSNISIDEFEYNLEKNIQSLASQIYRKSYQHGIYQKVVIKEKKRRDLAVAGVQDRVVHRYVYGQLVDLFDQSFDPDVWSCRKGKGLHKALARTQKLLKQYPNSYVWRADIAKFFDHVEHKKLLNCLKYKVLTGSTLFWLRQQIVDSYNVPDRQTDRQTDRYPRWQFN